MHCRCWGAVLSWRTGWGVGSPAVYAGLWERCWKKRPPLTLRCGIVVIAHGSTYLLIFASDAMLPAKRGPHDLLIHTLFGSIGSIIPSPPIFSPNPIYPSEWLCVSCPMLFSVFDCLAPSPYWQCIRYLSLFAGWSSVWRRKPSGPFFRLLPTHISQVSSNIHLASWGLGVDAAGGNATWDVFVIYWNLGYDIIWWARFVMHQLNNVTFIEHWYYSWILWIFCLIILYLQQI